jgi:phospholipase C
MAPPLHGVEHIVVLMLENRSFDNILGGLYPASPGFDGLTGQESIPLNPYDPGSPLVSVWQGIPGPPVEVMPYPDPGELVTDINTQIFAPTDPQSGPPTMRGFAYNYANQPASPDGKKPVARDIMQYYRHGSESDVPVSGALARNFAVSDRWFAAGPVQTLANRVFTHCATPSKYQDTSGSWRAVINNTDITNRQLDPNGIVDARTVFELLDEAAQLPSWPWPTRPAWRVYHHDYPLSAFIKYVDDHWDVFVNGNVYYISQFFDDLKGELPTYCFLEPRYTDYFGGTPNSNHPGGSTLAESPPPIDILGGELLLYNVVAALYAVPELFKKTLLVVVYDEHGGLYDHVAPPGAASPFGPNEVSGFAYDRYGPRVPAIVINPYIAPGKVLRPAVPHVFDHTTLISTLRAQFGLGGPLTARDASAPILADLVVEGAPLNPFQITALPKPVRPAVGPRVQPSAPRSISSNPNCLANVVRQSIESPSNADRAAYIRLKETAALRGS